jgi:poly(A) polymerase
MMKSPSFILLLAAFALLVGSCKKGSLTPDTTPVVLPAPTPTNWINTFSSGTRDNAGVYRGGNEIMQIVAHKGRLYAGNSYWMEPDAAIRSAEILRLDTPDGQWQVDKEFTNENLRVGAMKSFVFTTNGTGAAIKPDTLLLTIPNNNAGNVVFYVRNDATNTWISTTIATLPTDINCRALGLHKDAVNGKTFIFAGLIDYGIFSGTYSSTLAGKIQWATKPEFVAPPNERVMGFTVCNNAMYCATSDGGIGHIYKRTDGTGAWTLVKTLTGGGESEDVRGLSAIPNPGGSGEVLWLCWNNEALRIDPASNFATTVEYDFTGSLTTLLGVPIKYVLAAYNDNIPVFNPASATDDIRLIGFEMRYDPSALTGSNPPSNLNRWSTNGMYFDRRQSGRNVDYTLKYIVNNAPTVRDTLVATRSMCVSPFASDNRNVIYAGGFDCNSIPITKAAWIYRGTF